MIKDLTKGGTTVLLTTQYMEEADYPASQVVVIDHGGNCRRYASGNCCGRPERR
ncbi:hypothetical protein IPG36_03365 [bacterium]|nr:MAG: hypothetical protein IPG36_03365 [bacterium]